MIFYLNFLDLLEILFDDILTAVLDWFNGICFSIPHLFIYSSRGC
jgi:hypothetical protein